MQDRAKMLVAWVVFGGLLLVANAGLWFGLPQAEWVLLPAAVRQGEWWRLFLHPWVHVSGYHLLLDASAFLMLYFMLERERPGWRLGVLASAWLGQLLAVWWGEPRLADLGLCGLSGMAHGLFAAVCLQWRADPARRAAGTGLLFGLLAKTLWETLTGAVFLSGWHMGSVGSPLTLCHAGGVLGVSLAAGLRSFRARFWAFEKGFDVPAWGA